MDKGKLKNGKENNMGYDCSGISRELYFKT